LASALGTTTQLFFNLLAKEKGNKLRAYTARNDGKDFFVISTFPYLNISMFTQRLGKSVNDWSFMT
jgi:hypothetical protein